MYTKSLDVCVYTKGMHTLLDKDLLSPRLKTEGLHETDGFYAS